MASYGSTFDKHAARTAFTYATHKNATQCLVLAFLRFSLISRRHHSSPAISENTDALLLNWAISLCLCRRQHLPVHHNHVFCRETAFWCSEKLCYLHKQGTGDCKWAGHGHAIWRAHGLLAVGHQPSAANRPIFSARQLHAHRSPIIATTDELPFFCFTQSQRAEQPC